MISIKSSSFSFVFRDRRCLCWLSIWEEEGNRSSSCVSTLNPFLKVWSFQLLHDKTSVWLLLFSVWEQVIQKGDMVIDATCGNGNDTLAMLKMVTDESDCCGGCVYAMDIQKDAIESTSCLLDQTLGSEEVRLDD